MTNFIEVTVTTEYTDGDKKTDKWLLRVDAIDSIHTDGEIVTVNLSDSTALQVDQTFDSLQAKLTR